MSDDQFAALAELLRLRGGPAQESARLVLVGGLSVAEAAEAADVVYRVAYEAVARAQRGLELARRVVCSAA